MTDRLVRGDEDMVMDDQPLPRFAVIVEQGPPHGDLYELEQTTYYYVVDRHTQEVILTFRGEMEASLGDAGLWDNYHFSGVCEVTMAPDETAVMVKYGDGREEIVSLTH